MSSNKKTKTIHYKNVVISGSPNLQSLLEGILGDSGEIKRPNQRQQKANAEDTVVIFINRFTKYNGMSFGQLVYLEKGKQQPYRTVDDEADFYSIESLSSDAIPEKANDSGKVGSSPQNPTPPESFCQIVYMLHSVVSLFIRFIGQLSAHDGIMQTRTIHYAAHVNFHCN